jgi:hypothetical protein
MPQTEEATRAIARRHAAKAIEELREKFPALRQ